MNKKNNENGNLLKELVKTPRGKAIVFFGAYLIFFLIIAVMARVGGTNSSNKVYNPGIKNQFNMSSVLNDNYKFDYAVIIDDKVYNYLGSKTRNSQLFTVNNNDEYYAINDTYFTNSNGIWINTKNPFVGSEFMNKDNISKLIEIAMYQSKTEYETGKTVYNFKVSSASINNVFGMGDIDVEEVPNQIIISTDENNYVNKIEYILNSYCKAVEGCNESMNITLKYDLYGKIEEPASPLE